MSFVYKNCADTVAHTSGIPSTLRETAVRLQALAKARLDPHRESGAHKITIEKGVLDNFVVLSGPAAESLEFGRGYENGRRSEPLRILRGAIEEL